jgi:endonuclease/exonuclease/phosphatase family metal-dependent hydrolase
MACWRLIGTRLVKAIALTLALGAMGTPASAADCGGRSCIAIGSYNIKTLGVAKNPTANTPQELADLAHRIDAIMDLDVVVLEEIDTGSSEWAVLKADLEKRGYDVAAEGTDGGKRRQFVVILHRTATVTATSQYPKNFELPGMTEYGDTQCKPYELRPPLVTGLKAGSFDFTMMGVHLKSNNPPYDDSELFCDDNMRKFQAEKIAEFYASAKATDADVIVAGDFNNPFQYPEFSALQKSGFASAMDDLEAGSGKFSHFDWNHSSNSVERTALFDHVAIPGDRNAYVPGSGLIFKVRKKDREYYFESQSDHVPVRALFYTDMDQD